jgi:hypothetical protein
MRGEPGTQGINPGILPGLELFEQNTGTEKMKRKKSGINLNLIHQFFLAVVKIIIARGLAL